MTSRKNALLAAAALGYCALSYAPAALAEGASIKHASRSQKDKARKSYREGLEAYDAKQYDKALELLRESYATVASPNSLLVIARTLAQLDRLSEAYRELENAMRLAEELAKVDDKYQETVASAQKELEELSKKLALVVVQPDTAVSIADAPVAHQDWGRPLPYAPGKLRVVVEHGNGQHTEQELELVAGEKTQVSTAPPPPPPPPEPEPPPPPIQPSAPPEDGVSKRTLAYVSGAIGLLGVGAFATFLYLDNTTDERYGCGVSLCPESTVDTVAKDSTYQTLAFVGLGVGLIGLGTGSYLFFTSEPASAEEQPTTALALGPGQVTLHGTF